MSSMAPLRDRAPSNTLRTQPQTTTPLRIAKRDSPQTASEERTPALTPSRRRSVKNLQDGARVSNSPFLLSQLSVKPGVFYASPTRRVSGEKRSRSQSMHEQAENENPAIRKRRQSQVSELLTQKRPVTNSTFKAGKAPSTDKPRRVSQESKPPAPLPPQQQHEQPPQTIKDEIIDDNELPPPPPPPPKEWFGRASPHRGQSPARPSLVSRRLHGPRVSRKISRRKTVTFDENCDVLEFDVEEDNSNPFDWVTDDDENYETDRMNVDDDGGHHHRHDDVNDDDVNDDDDHDLQGGPSRNRLRVLNPEPDDSFDHYHVGDDSITGLVNSMLNDARPRTPPQDEGALPDDLETEDGVPYGRTHHAERYAAAHQHHHPEDVEASIVSFPVPAAATSTPTRSREGTPMTSVSPGSRVPLGRSTHSERLMAQKEQEKLEVDNDLQMMPSSPSPTKKQNTMPSSRPNPESLIPKFSLQHSRRVSSLSTSFDVVDPFSRPQSNDTSRAIDVSLDSIRRVREDPSNLSIGTSEVSLSGLDFDLDLKEAGPRSSTDESTMPATSTPPTSPPNHPFAFTSFHSNFSRESLSGRISTPTKPSPFNDTSRAGSPSLHASRDGSPAFARTPQSQSGSPLVRSSYAHLELTKAGSSTNLLGSPSGSPSGRGPRITRETVQRKLEKERSLDSPLREAPKGDFSPRTDVQRSRQNSLEPSVSPARPEPEPKVTPSSRPAPKRVPPPKISRDNPTYDGVMFLDPEPQPADPPRPSFQPRSASLDNVAATSAAPDNSRPSLPPNFESGGGPMANLNDMKSALDRLMADVAGEATLAPDGKGVIGLKIEAVTEGVKAGKFTVPPTVPTPITGAEDSQDDIDTEGDVTREDSQHMDVEEHSEHQGSASNRRPESLLQASFLSPDSTGNHGHVRPLSPQPGTGNAIRAREELIKAMKARKREEEEEEALEAETSVEYFTPPRRASTRRVNRRRSRSTSDAEGLQERRTNMRQRADTLSGGGLLDTVPIEDEEDMLGDSIDRELRRLKGEHAKYYVRERTETIYASADLDTVSHSNSAGDIETGKAWRTIRRQSEINEHAQQLKELSEQENVTKAFGKVFVKVLGIRGLDVPMPQQPTAMTLTLNNGIHYVTTPPARLARECRLDQEFELVEHGKLEFTLTLNIRLDPHIQEQFKANIIPSRPPAAKEPSPPASKGGMHRFFGGQKKVKPRPVAHPPPPPPRLPENLARYLKPDGILARTFVSFKDIARRCDTKLFESSFPLIGQRSEVASPPKAVQVGEIVLQFFRLPPLPGLLPKELPQSLGDCHRGLRHIGWHKTIYHEGTLTQNGGDCMSWRRRQLRVIGANLTAFNDVTRKATATIDLKKAISVEDDRELHTDVLSPASGHSSRTSRYMEDDGLYGIGKSFRLLFNNNQAITFFADTEEEKAEWVKVLRALVGNIPPNPLWAELLWQREQAINPQPEDLRIMPVPTPSPQPELARARSPISNPRPPRPGSRQT